MEKAKELWKKLGDVPTKNEKIDEPFLHFEVGTDLLKIWHWFEEEFDVRVYDLMYPGSILIQKEGE